MAASKFYILNDDHNLVPSDYQAWIKWFSTSDDRHVEQSDISPGVWVSTVFLGIDHQYSPEGPPLVFETMIFGGEFDQCQVRSSSWEEARSEHFKACRIAGIKAVSNDEVLNADS